MVSMPITKYYTGLDNIFMNERREKHTEKKELTKFAIEINNR